MSTSLFEEAIAAGNAEAKAVVDGFQVKAEADLAALTRDLAAAVAAGGDKDAEIATLNGKIAELRARIAELEKAPDPEPDPEPEPIDPEPTGRVFGANGRYWPPSTPKLTDTFDVVVESAPDWAQVAAAVKSALSAAKVTDKIRVDVLDGTFPAGFGAGSTNAGVLQNLGAADRIHNVLITPKNPGKVKASGAGNALVNTIGITLVGIDFTGSVLMIRNSTRTYISRTFCKGANLTSNAAPGLTDCLYVDVVCGPESEVIAADRCALRVANGFNSVGSGWRGVYFAPRYRPAGSSAHCDTVQLSSQGGDSIGYVLEGSTIWQSSNQGFMPSESFHAHDGIVKDNLFIGGPTNLALRYPIPSTAYQTTGDRVWAGGAARTTSIGNIILGDLADGNTFVEVRDTIVTEPEVASIIAGNGSFTVDTSLRNPSKEQVDAWTPYPTVERQAAVWK